MSGLRAELTLGALGGPNTFGGDAANYMRRIYPEFSELKYFRTAEEGFSFEHGNDAMCAPQQMARTGFHAGVNSTIAGADSRLYVICDVTHVYHCSLLVKPGTALTDIKEIRGHTGSITQSRPWLEQHLPQARIRIVDTSSHEAAREVSLGDGTLASVGTPGMAGEFNLQQAATDIDGGSSANYWAISPHPLFSATPQRIVVAGRFDDRGDLGRLIGALGETGYHLQSIFSQASGLRLFEYDFAVRFSGRGTLSVVQDVLTRFSGARLAGAYDLRT